MSKEDESTDFKPTSSGHGISKQESWYAGFHGAILHCTHNPLSSFEYVFRFMDRGEEKKIVLNHLEVVLLLHITSQVIASDKLRVPE